MKDEPFELSIIVVYMTIMIQLLLYLTLSLSLFLSPFLQPGYKCSIAGCEVTCSSWSEMRKHSSAHAKGYDLSLKTLTAYT